MLHIISQLQRDSLSCCSRFEDNTVSEGTVPGKQTYPTPPSSFPCGGPPFSNLKPIVQPFKLNIFGRLLLSWYCVHDTFTVLWHWLRLTSAANYMNEWVYYRFIIQINCGSQRQDNCCNVSKMYLGNVNTYPLLDLQRFFTLNHNNTDCCVSFKTSYVK